MKRLFLISASLIIASSAFGQKCVTAPVSISGGQTSITTTGAKSVTKEKQYVYFERKHRRHEAPYRKDGIDNNYPSTPLFLSSEKQVNPVAETYNVSLSTPESNVSVCPDSAFQLTANINVEKVSSYTGNYPDYTDNKMYKRISKHHYKMAERKLRKIKRDERKVQDLSGQSVDIRTDKA
jgi:hypothetical protein